MHINIALEGTTHPHCMAIFTPFMWKFLSGSFAGITKYDAAISTESQVPVYLLIAS